MHPEVVAFAPGSCPKCGMALEPRVASADDAAEDRELVDMRRRLLLSAALTIPLFLVAMAEMLPGDPIGHWLGGAAITWIQLALATPVVVWGAAPFFARGIRSVRTRSLNMFTLIALGTAAAYGYSLVATFLPDLFPPAMRGHRGVLDVYFEAAAVITTLVLLGQVLELRARSRTSDAIRSLLRLAPKTARRIGRDGAEEDVPLPQVEAGDRLRVRPGERVPTDGVIVEGASAIDELRERTGDDPLGSTSRRAARRRAGRRPAARALRSAALPMGLLRPGAGEADPAAARSVTARARPAAAAPCARRCPPGFRTSPGRRSS